jgi:ribosomal protein S18 acetylase RimI-like enzyme
VSDSNLIENPAGIFAWQSAAAPCDFSQLDNPIWNALRTEHSKIAQGDGLARRYPPAIGPLSGMADTSPSSYDALSAVAGPAGVVALFLQQRAVPPPNWTLMRDGLLHQMIQLRTPSSQPAPAEANTEILRLTSADVPAMVELATLTEPGPFDQRTMELGTFFGIFDSGRLLAMAGERMSLPQFVEVSAVCTHPEARGRGYAKLLISAVVRHIRSLGKTPFLHVFAANHSAIRVYEDLGFTLRRTLELAVLKNEG